MTQRQQLIASRAAYVAVVLLATLTDLHFSGDLAAASERLARALTFSLAWRDAVDGLRNIALFAGLGGVWVATSLTGRVRGEILRATVLGVSISVMVEGLQCFSPVRTASLVDVTTNTLGAFSGALGVALLIAALRHAKGARSYLGVPAFLLAGAYGLAALCEATTPLFHSEPVPGADGGPLDRLRMMLRLARPFSADELRWLDIPLFAVAGFLAVMLLGELGRDRRRAWPVVSVLGSALVVAAHFSHGLFALPIRWEAAAGDALALTAGAVAAHHWLARLTQSLRGATRARAAIFAYGGVLVLWGWRPLMPETHLQAIASQFKVTRFVPLASLAERVDVFSAVHVAQQFLLYLPLGAILAVWPLRLAGRWSNLWPGIGLAFAIELGHIVIVDRFFDVTNALIACAGLGIGWIVMRRSGFDPHGEAIQPGRPGETTGR
jgi:glycopeptide antibiotics resistance protein